MKKKSNKLWNFKNNDITTAFSHRKFGGSKRKL